jgi:hypothetical protein
MLALEPNALISSSAKVNEGVPAPVYVVDSTSWRNVVLVAGYDFPHDATMATTGVTFKKFCDCRLGRYLKRGDEVKNNPNWVFTMFDVPAGKVYVNTFDTASRKRTSKVEKTFAQVNTTNYSPEPLSNNHIRFNKNTAGAMSITDVYEYVRGLGTAQPGSLVELSFFSHGWIGGPILVNSIDNPSLPGRDPADKDARSHKDFITPAMDATALAEFQSAFHPDGFSWIWGCSFAASKHHVLAKVVSNSKYTTAKGPVDADQFTLTFNKSQAELYFEYDTIFFPARDTVTHEYPLTFTRTFEEVKKFFERGIKNSYAWKLAKASGRKCYGAPPGTYAAYERGVSLPLMVIPTKEPPYDDNFTSYIGFYKKHLAVKFDSDGRGYAEHSP